jgi:hypothetical protein
MKKAGYFILAVLFLSFFAFSFVSAETNGAAALNSVESAFGGHSSVDWGKFFDNLFNNQYQGNDIVVQILVFFLVALVIYSISPFIPFISGKPIITWGMTLIVAYLSIYSVRLDEIKAVLLSYGAMGLVITLIIPFFAIAVISKKSYDEGKPGIFSKAIWIAFLLMLVYKWATASVADDNSFSRYLMIAVGILALVMLFFEYKIWKVLLSSEKKAEVAGDMNAIDSAKRDDLVARAKALAVKVQLAIDSGNDKERKEAEEKLDRINRSLGLGKYAK